MLIDSNPFFILFWFFGTTLFRYAFLSNCLFFPRVPTSRATIPDNMRTRIKIPNHPTAFAEGRLSWRVLVEYLAVFFDLKTGKAWNAAPALMLWNEMVVEVFESVSSPSQSRNYWLRHNIELWNQIAVTINASGYFQDEQCRYGICRYFEVKVYNTIFREGYW